MVFLHDFKSKLFCLKLLYKKTANTFGTPLPI